MTDVEQVFKQLNISSNEKNGRHGEYDRCGLALHYELNNSFVNKKAFREYFQRYSFQHLY